MSQLLWSNMVLFICLPLWKFSKKCRNSQIYIQLKWLWSSNNTAATSMRSLKLKENTHGDHWNIQFKAITAQLKHQKHFYPINYPCSSRHPTAALESSTSQIMQQLGIKHAHKVGERRKKNTKKWFRTSKSHACSEPLNTITWQGCCWANVVITIIWSLPWKTSFSLICCTKHWGRQFLYT